VIHDHPDMILIPACRRVTDNLIHEINRGGWTYTANNAKDFLLLAHCSIHHVINHNPP
jgi:hypothetical protein